MKKLIGMNEREWAENLWSRVRGLVGKLSDRISALEQGAGSGVTGVKGNLESTYRTGNVNLTPANLGAVSSSDIANDLTTTTAGKVLDARQGKALSDMIGTAIASVYRYKGSVATYADLPSSGQVVGDVWDVQATGNNYAWTGTGWDALGGIGDLSSVWSKTELVAMTNQAIDNIMDAQDEGNYAGYRYAAAAAARTVNLGEAVTTWSTDTLSWQASAVEV